MGETIMKIPEGFEIVDSKSAPPNIPEGFEVVDEAKAPSQKEVRAALSGLGDDLSYNDAGSAPNNSEDSSALDSIIGAGEAALSIGTGATTGAAGHIGGAISGLVKEIAAGNYGEQEAADRIEAAANEMASKFTYAPRTDQGKEQAQSVGEALAPLAAIPPIAQAQVIGAASGAAGRQAAASARGGAASLIEQARRRIETRESLDGSRSVGASETPRELQRSIIAEAMPVPFEGDSALTKGQATRNFEQLQFERETAKIGDIGGPLRARVENQTNTLIANLDAISDLSDPARFDLRDIGRAVDSALINKHKNMKKRERMLYKRAEESGEMREKVAIRDAQGVFEALDEMEDVATNAQAIKRNAIKRGIIDEVSGAANEKTLSEIERFRQFVNDATDISDPKAG